MNKSVSISIIPAGDSHLTAYPVVPVRKGDFLGIFSAMIHFPERVNLVYSIRELAKKL